MNRVVLHDVDSQIPNLALMKLSTHYRKRGWEVHLDDLRRNKARSLIEGELHLASSVFFTTRSRARIQALRDRYGDRLEVGGSGFSLEKRLPPDLDGLFPDYSLYNHSLFALGFLTRGCNKRCSFCVVPAKEGRLKRLAYSFDDFVPPKQRNVMLLDDNLLAFTGVEALLKEMIQRKYAVNFSQTLDIAYLTEEKAALLRQIDYQSARFANPMIYFSLNYARTNHHFEERRSLLKAFGKDCVTVVCIYGFDTSLSEDYQRFRLLRKFQLIPFFQEYWPIQGVPSRLPSPFFDMDLNLMIRLTYRANGYNWEKYLRWLNRRYFEEFGRFYKPLVQVIYRYNNKPRLQWYLDRPEWMTEEMYRDFRDSPPGGARTFLDGLGSRRVAGIQASMGVRKIAEIFDLESEVGEDETITRATV
ncbi:MAG: putative iron sulfur protein [Verrucomicrobiales bacterium]|nr:putative iron sulfur protein [Verrucomicrobiales bacterium]